MVPQSAFAPLMHPLGGVYYQYVFFPLFRCKNKGCSGTCKTKMRIFASYMLQRNPSNGMMDSFRQNIRTQVMKMEKGKIFTSDDLIFAPQKRANVAAVLSEMAKKGAIVRAAKGTYFRPKPSLLGLKYRPLEHQEKLDFISKRLNGYITGAYVFNQMQLTEQVAMVVTVATPKPVRAFELGNVRVKCVKSYVDDLRGVNLYHLRLLDAIKSIREIPGTTPSDVYDRLIQHHFCKLQGEELNQIAEVAQKYPPRVRKILSDIYRYLAV